VVFIFLAKLIMNRNITINASLRPANFSYADTMNWLRLSSALLLSLLLALLTQLSGCAGPAYYAQAISGHLHLMRSRVPVSELLAAQETDPELARRLRQTQLMRQFAYDHLGLPVSKSYTRMAVTNKNAVTWNVIAAPEFSVDPRLWCFPVAGCVAYRGYFDHSKAETFARKMKSKSFDVIISPAIAYSTLGWFEDPLLDTMLQYSDAMLAGIIFHELAHERLYVRSDTAFNEAFASFAEETGVRLWLSAMGRNAEIGQWENRRKAAVQLNRLLKETREQLAAVYANGQSDELKRQQKGSTLNSLRMQYQALVETDWEGVDYFASWMTGDLNNAHLVLMDSYQGGTCAFAELFEESGKNLEQFYALAEEKAAMKKELRKSWLDRSCVQIASGKDL
jgi:predicted aminopeptidase